ncbi:Cof-type HAD-IIB family hydrolase [Brachybacterium huguangmaarense]|uniref:Cof-type HAD-IIB family hydrolase n=1 Tax=Brachybacterium huguangmaarense TaxID=1652028 RepID=A0ABY6G567_9MICO|nr:HAD family hydrolase [Brachybacterium huguangmaarense]UYG17818.1 Cof-type HAD-IIB family hydrolase [Brachybacterium huguangmaarense]
MPRPRLVASDLDGTLLDTSGVITERTARTWHRLWDEGIATVLVTARPPRWVDHLAQITGDHGVVICANGAFVYDAAHQRIRENHGLAPELLHELLADLRTIDGIAFSAELAGGFHREAAYPGGTPDGMPEIGHESVGPLEAIEEPVGKLLAVSEALEPRRFLAAVTEIIGDRALLSTSCEGGLAEIGPAGVTKARALASWSEGLGIAGADVWAFGDMPNDIPMLTWAGTGWAVAGAHPDVLAVADRTCGPNSADGVAAALEDMLAGREGER